MAIAGNLRVLHYTPAVGNSGIQVLRIAPHVPRCGGQGADAPELWHDDRIRAAVPIPEARLEVDVSARPEPHSDPLMTLAVTTGACLLAFSASASAQAPPYGQERHARTGPRRRRSRRGRRRRTTGTSRSPSSTPGSTWCTSRHDQTQLGNADIATRKAWTAVAFKQPTKLNLRWQVVGRPARAGHRPSLSCPSGRLPLTIDGKIVGAIGVSGVQPAQDGQVAKAGADALH